MLTGVDRKVVSSGTKCQMLDLVVSKYPGFKHRHWEQTLSQSMTKVNNNFESKSIRTFVR